MLVFIVILSSAIVYNKFIYCIVLFCMRYGAVYVIKDSVLIYIDGSMLGGTFGSKILSDSIDITESIGLPDYSSFFLSGSDGNTGCGYYYLEFKFS